MEAYNQDQINQEKEKIAQFYESFGMLDMAKIIRESVKKEFRGSIEFLWHTARELKRKVDIVKTGRFETITYTHITERDYLPRLDSYFKKPVSPFCPKYLVAEAICLENLVGVYFAENGVSIQSVMGGYTLYSELLKQLNQISCVLAMISRQQKISTIKPTTAHANRDRISVLIVKFYHIKDTVLELLTKSEPEFTNTFNRSNSKDMDALKKILQEASNRPSYRENTSYLTSNNVTTI